MAAHGLCQVRCDSREAAVHNFSLDIAKASGGGRKLAIAGLAALKPWKVGSDTIAAEFNGLDFGMDETSGKATGQLIVNLDGASAAVSGRAREAQALSAPSGIAQPSRQMRRAA